ncbi:MAG: FadR family transcriptional regulator [Desulfovibrionaceae bacterium]|nr:FadR family transcriptional regulator [Desulfovibrionaceae bacterium]
MAKSAKALGPTRKQKVFEDIVDRIQGLIHRGELRSGDRLPPERVLAGLFRVSRNSVREAIRAMEEKGLLSIRPGDGTYVLAKGDASLVEPLARAIQQGRERLDEIFLLRRLIEPEMAFRAAENASAEDLLALRGILRAQAEAVARGEAAADLDSRFHLRLYGASKSRVLCQVAVVLHDFFDESRSEPLQSRKRQKVSLDSHWAVLKALEARDPARAREMMRRHLDQVEASVFDSGGPDD